MSEGNRDLWQAVAVGDACLAHVRAGRLVASFPLGPFTTLTNAPLLLGSADGGGRADGERVAGGPPALSIRGTPRC